MIHISQTTIVAKSNDKNIWFNWPQHNNNDAVKCPDDQVNDDAIKHYQGVQAMFFVLTIGSTNPLYFDYPGTH